MLAPPAYPTRLEFVQVRHEELAAFKATAHARLTGELGVCMATSGPGGIHLLNGLYDAKLDHQPVVAIVGQQRRMSLGGSYQQEVDLVSLFKDVAHEYVHVCMEPSQARHLLDRAVRTAYAARSVTCVIVPEDVQESEHSEPPRVHGATYSGGGLSTARVTPSEEDLLRAEVLNDGGAGGHVDRPGCHGGRRAGPGGRRHPRLRGGQGAQRTRRPAG